MVKFPESPTHIRLTREEMAAHLLLRTPSLLTAKDGEQVANFYDPRTRTLAPADDPVFESKSEEARQNWNKQREEIETFLRIKHRWPTWEDWKEELPYYDGKEEFECLLAFNRWAFQCRVSVDLNVNGIEEIVSVDGDTRWRKATKEDLQDQSLQEDAANNQAREAWLRWRDKLTLYIQRIRLASLIVARRNETGLSQEQFARVANVSASTIKNFENVDDPDRWFSPKTLHLMEKALGWETGSIATILRGGEPKQRSGWRPPTPAGQGSDEGATAVGSVKGIGQPEGQTQSQVAIRIDAESLELLRRIALQEDRTINSVVADTIDFYAKYHLNKESS